MKITFYLNSLNLAVEPHSGRSGGVKCSNQTRTCVKGKTPTQGLDGVHLKTFLETRRTIEMNFAKSLKFEKNFGNNFCNFVFVYSRKASAVSAVEANFRRF